MNYYEIIKSELIDNELTKKAKDYAKNKSDLTHYYNAGKLLDEAGKHYGEGIIPKYSLKLTSEVSKKYNVTNLKRMRQFYRLVLKGATLWHQLSWSHYKLLISIHIIDKINYYSRIAVEYNYSVRQLEERIKMNEYERLDIKTKNKIMNKERIEITDLIKNPIIIKNSLNREIINERYLKKNIRRYG